ncbi:CoxG family protein [Variovorax ureilyticus]|uniref:CoxG family protein n=1 Tax=Variovorax ureilyticus TaxID=1836198 RepID=UPI003D67A9A7
MEVKLDKRYPLDVDAARAWQVLRDVKAVAGCMPGAAITEQVDETHYKGNVKVKVGPANAAFAGDIQVLELDDAAKKLRMLGKGADRSGSSASMELGATIEPGETPAISVLAGQAVVTVSGKFAQFGSRLLVPVSDMLLAQFVDNFRAAASALPGPASDEAAPAGASAPTASNEPVAPPQQRELNALAMLWALIKGWFAGLGGKRT